MVKHILPLFIILGSLHSLYAQFRVHPYLLAPREGGMTICWFTEGQDPGKLILFDKGSNDTQVYNSKPQFMDQLLYSELEEAERPDFPDMFRNENWMHQIELEGLKPGAAYDYEVHQGEEVHRAHFWSPPSTGAREAVHFVVLADSETDPAGRKTYRDWAIGLQHPNSTGRPDSLTQYLLTETEGYRANLAAIKKENPDFMLLPGDIVQGGGYQRAWDEFFFHNAGKFDNPLSHFPLIPAIGNWENFGARNGGYDPEAVAASRAKYQAYFPAPANNNPNYQNYYYRIDYGPVTILTLDSSNGLPDSTDADTNININAAEYPGKDLPDINPGSDQWNWVVEQLKEAQAAGQVIFVQFHHIPYSSGGHSLPLTAEGSSGQAGIPMRVFTPIFKEYGVVAVFCGHNESFEHSKVEGIHFWDVGIAGDGFGYSVDHLDPRRQNPYRKWVAHRDAEEYWKGKKLIDGGKHYGHLQVEVLPEGEKYRIRMTPHYLFPKTNRKGIVVEIEKRQYDHIVEVVADPLH